MNQSDLQAWLLARPEATRQQDAALIAIRTAARVFPLSDRAWERPDFDEQAGEKLVYNLLVARCILIGLVATLYSSPQIKAALRNSRRDLLVASQDRKPNKHFAGTSVAHAAQILVAEANNDQEFDDYLLGSFSKSSFFAMVLAQAASPYRAKSAVEPRIQSDIAAQNATWQQVEFDIVALGSGNDLSSKALWVGSLPDWFSVPNELLRRLWASEPSGVWNFWTRWWDGLVAGQPLDWALQEKVALIPDDIWQQGAAAVARAIRDIEEAMALPEPSDTDMEKVIEQTRHGAVLFYDPDTKLIGEEAVSTLPQDVQRDVVDLMQDVLSGFPAASAGNNIYELIRRERDILKRAIDAYQARPWMLLTSLRRARAGVQDKVADGTCPQNDPLLNDLVAQIVQAEVLLITHDAELAVAVRNQERLPDVTLTAEDLHLLTAGMQALQGHATPELSIVIEADLAAIADTNLPIPHRKAAMLSTIARLVQVRALGTGKAKRSLFGNSRFGVAEVASWVTIFDGIARVLTASGAWEWILVVIQRLQ